MPHIVIEYSAEGHAPFDITEVLEAVHASAAATGVMAAADLKVRATKFDDYLVAGTRDGFFHASVYLLEGRTPEQKVLVSEALRATLVELLPGTRAVSVDIRDMDAIAYKKRLLAP